MFSIVQILELSGIGDKKVLEHALIDTFVDLPGVGNNVQEHVYSGASYGTNFKIILCYLFLTQIFVRRGKTREGRRISDIRLSP